MSKDKDTNWNIEKQNLKAPETEPEIDREPPDLREEEGEPETEQEQEQELTELEQLQQKFDALNDRYLRLLAEYDNFRKRTQREKDELSGYVTAGTVEKFLPVFDNLERAAGYDTGSEEFAKGFELIRAGLQDVLKNLGVQSYAEEGDSFNPDLHHAVSHIEDESLGENIVSQVMQKGYKLGERVIRHALVQTAN